MGLLERANAGKIDSKSKVLRKVVPGYDYRTKQKRSETDQKIRDKVERECQKALEALDNLSSELHRSDNDDEALERVNDVKKKVRSAEREAMNSASGGGFLSNVENTKDENLTELIEYDAKIVEASGELAEKASKVSERPVKAKNVDKELREVRDQAQQIKNSLKDRKDFLKGL